MRQLKITKTLTPAQQAEASQALQLLHNLPVPTGWLPHLYAEYLVPNFRFILSLASQYQDRGLSLTELVTAGHAAAVACIIRHGEHTEPDGSWWVVRQGILGALYAKRKAG